MPAHNVTMLSVEELHLDLRNPRLPEDIQGKSEKVILEFLFRNGVLEELAHSFKDNGFFAGEPLIVTRERSKYVVLEGNRRLATLKVLCDPDPESMFFDIEVDKSQFSKVPCVIVGSRDEVSGLIGFRHIGGLKMWTPVAKARYIVGEVEKLAKKQPNENAFKAFGRKVGSNAAGVRGPFQAFLILKYARDNLELDGVNHLLLERKFGVWQRALSSPDLRTFIGYDAGSDYTESLSGLTGINAANLQQVIHDIGGDTPGAEPVVTDSRQLTEYGRILLDQDALGILRKTRDFAAARTRVSGETLREKVIRATRQLAAIESELQALKKIDLDLASAVTGLSNVAERLQLIASKRAK